MTLNQIISFINGIATNHKQINHFFCGTRDTWQVNGDIPFPAMFIELQNSNASRINKQTTHTFVCVLADLADVAANSQDNEIEVQSDLCQIAEDIISVLNKEGDRNSDFIPSKEIKIDYFTSILEDVCVGVGFEFSISTKYNANSCQVPTIDTPIVTPQSPYIVNTYPFRNTIERDRFTISSLMSKSIILLLIDGESPIRIELGGDAPKNDEYTYDYTTGEFVFGKTIFVDQLVQIITKPR